MMMNEMTSTRPTVKLNELEKLAKLLATENIVVEHSAVPTASFDTKTRVLTLPMWKDISKELYHMLVVHEISHALETDPVKWAETIAANSGIRATLNIVEDARIERLAKRRYPGTRRDFREGYAELFERDFFKLNKDLNTYSFIDRINIHYKIGHLVSVPFSDEEMAFVNIIDNTDDMDGIIAVALRLFARAKEKNENKQNPEEQEKQGGADDDDNQSGSQNDDKESDETDGVDGESDDKESDETDGPSNKSGDQPEQGEDGADTSVAGDGAGAPDETQSQTQSNIDEEMKSLNIGKPDHAGRVSYVDYGRRIDFDKYIVPYDRTISEALIAYKDNVNAASAVRFTKLRAKNIRVVDYLCKEFEQRKAADQYIRAKEAKSGVINPNKLHSYKMVDDIFRKVTVNPDAKNHGLVIMVDFSGSMGSNIMGTIEQLLTIVMFCRKTGIAHRVFGFIDGWDANWSKLPEDKEIFPVATGRRTFVPDTSMRLVELFTDKMNTTAFRTMSECLLYAFETDSWGGMHNGQVKSFRLNGTPLNCALILARDILVDFKMKSRAQIVSLVLLTDGDSNLSQVQDERGNVAPMYASIGNTVIRDVRTGRVYTEVCRHTQALVEIIRRDGFEVTNFFIASRGTAQSKIRKYSFSAGKNDKTYDSTYNEFRKSGAVSLTDYDGFSEYYIILGGSALRTSGSDEFEFDVKSDATTKQIAKAFVVARKNRMSSRIVLQNFAKKIAA